MAMHITVNIHGRQGKNIPCDLFLEHLNREAKCCIGALGAVHLIGKSIGCIVKVLNQFDKVNDIKKPSDRHSKRSCKKEILIKQLHETSEVFKCSTGRKCKSFKKFTANCMKSADIDELNKWMMKQLVKAEELLHTDE